MSNTLSERRKQALIKTLSSIENSSFDENDISELLRYIRPFSEKNSLIWEFASFIAHTEERTMGLFKAKMDYCYSVFVYANFQKHSVSKQFNIFEIEKNIFENVVLNNLEMINEKFLLYDTGFSRNEAKKFISGAYELNKTEKKWYLKKDIKILVKTQKILSSIFSIIDGSKIIDNNDLINQLCKTLLKANIILDNKFPIKTIIKNNEREILLCLMCLLHSHEFRLFDKSIANCELMLEKKPDDKLTLSLVAYVTLINNIKNLKVVWSIMSVNDSIENYIPNLNNYNFEENESLNLEGFNAVRDSYGNLLIKKI